MHAYFVPKATYDGGEVGCAVLSKFPAKAMLTLRYKSWKVHGSTRWGGPGPQAAVAVSVRPPGFQTDIWVISTQLGGDASGQVQLAEMSELTHWIPAFCGHYTLPNGMPTITAKQATAGPIGDITVAVAGFRNDVAMQRQQLTRDQDRLPLITASNSDLMNVKAGCCCCSARVLPLVAPASVVLCGDLFCPSHAPALKYAHWLGLEDVGSRVGCSMCCRRATTPAHKPIFGRGRVLLSSDGSLEVSSLSHY